MANLVLARPDVFPASTTVALYPASQRHPEGRAPLGSAAPISTAVATDTSVTLTGATAGAPYACYALVGGVDRYVSRIQ